MEEITIKINKTAVFAVGALIVGAVLGYSGGVYKSRVSAENTNNPANNAVLQGDTAGNNQVSPQITVTASDHLRGAKNAQVVLVEYSDFQCSYCKNHNPTMQKIIKEFGNEVAWIYRHYPLSFHQNAQIASEASECASEQGKFWEYADVLFVKGNGDGTGLTPPELEGYARNLGLNSSQFETCLASHKYASRVNADFASGGAAGVEGTPATILLDNNGNTKLISGAVSYEELKAEIQAALK